MHKMIFCHVTGNVSTSYKEHRPYADKCNVRKDEVRISLFNIQCAIG